MKFYVACGGTGGHIIPGLATAQELAGRGHDVTLWLGGRDVEAVSTSGWAGPVVSIPAVRFPGRHILGYPAFAIRISMAVFAAWREIRRTCPHAVLAMGSYTSIGPVVAARMCRVPVVLHEANAVPGRAIAVLSRFASATGLNFPQAAKYLGHSSTKAVGLPLRSDLQWIEHDGPPQFSRLLVMGGSQGAQAINRIIPAALKLLSERGTLPQITHLSGRANFEEVRKLYHELDIDAEVHDFVSDMASIYASADFAIARAGAASCMELAVCGVPALLIPHPTVPGDHQTRNAEAMAFSGGFDMRRQSRLTPEWLAEYLEKRLKTPDIISDMRNKQKLLEVGNGAKRLADLVEESAK